MLDHQWRFCGHLYGLCEDRRGFKFSAFIVERGFEGFTQGPEEHKMGIKRDPLRYSLYFQDCKVPVENLLGEIGKGHVIAFNILNIGRLKLCAAGIGASKRLRPVRAYSMPIRGSSSRRRLRISVRSRTSWRKWPSRSGQGRAPCTAAPNGSTTEKPI